MKLFRLAIPLVALALVTLVRAQAAAPAASSIPTGMAVVNIGNIFDKLDEKASGDAELENLSKDLNKQKNEKQKAIDDLVAKLQNNSLFKPDSPEYKQMQEDLLEKTMDLQTFNNYAPQKLALEQRLKTLSIYRHMNDAIETYAKANGIGIVFVADDANFGGASTTDQLRMAIGNRKIMFADSHYDITKKIIEKMNSDRMLAPGK